MDNQKTVVVGGEVKGDITSCKIESQKIKEVKESVWSLQTQNTYVSYDVCNRKIISTYNVPQFTLFGGLMVVVIPFIVILILIGWISSHN